MGGGAHCRACSHVQRGTRAGGVQGQTAAPESSVIAEGGVGSVSPASASSDWDVTVRWEYWGRPCVSSEVVGLMGTG